MTRSPAALVDVLTSLAEADGPPGQGEVELPSFCPAADAPQVTALLGVPAPYVTLRHLDDPKRRPALDREAFLGMTEGFAAERAEFHSSH